MKTVVRMPGPSSAPNCCTLKVNPVTIIGIVAGASLGLPVRRHVQSSVVFVGGAYLGEGFVTGQGQCSDVIQKRPLLIGKFLLILGDKPPTVPGQDFDLVQCQQVAQEIAADEPHPAHVKDAKMVRVSLASAAHQPGFSPGQELIPGHVERVELDLKNLALQLVELGVYQHPALVFGFPVLANPVILIVLGRKYAPKPQRARAGMPW